MEIALDNPHLHQNWTWRTSMRRFERVLLFEDHLQYDQWSWRGYAHQIILLQDIRRADIVRRRKSTSRLRLQLLDGKPIVLAVGSAFIWQEQINKKLGVSMLDAYMAPRHAASTQRSVHT